jgi:hypothetical protein
MVAVSSIFTTAKEDGLAGIFSGISPMRYMSQLLVAKEAMLLSAHSDTRYQELAFYKFQFGYPQDDRTAIKNAERMLAMYGGVGRLIGYFWAHVWGRNKRGLGTLSCGIWFCKCRWFKASLWRYWPLKLFGTLIFVGAVVVYARAPATDWTNYKFMVEAPLWFGAVVGAVCVAVACWGGVCLPCRWAKTIRFHSEGDQMEGAFKRSKRWAMGFLWLAFLGFMLVFILHPSTKNDAGTQKNYLIIWGGTTAGVVVCVGVVVRFYILSCFKELQELIGCKDQKRKYSEI